MNLLTEILQDTLSQAFEQLGYASEAAVSISDRRDLCQFQCNSAFSLAKKYGKPPKAIAFEAVEIIRDNPIFSQVEAAGAGFINITLADSFICEYAAQVLKDPFLGIPQASKKELIFLDYGGPNVAKPLHIGHLRSAVIGESLKRLAQATGRDTLCDVHLGDWGLQIGLVIAELKVRFPQYFNGSDKNIPLTPEDLNEIYPYASRKSKEDSDFRSEAQRVTAELQAGNPLYRELWQKITAISTGDMKKSYDKLGVHFDLWYGESDAEKYVGRLVDTLSKKGLIYESQGAMVVDVAEDSDNVIVPPVIIKKSDSSNIYATTDLAAIIQRQEDYSPSQFWYIVDMRQALHFKQVFRCAKKAGLVPDDTKLEHLGFGTMNGPDGKPYKTRDGGVMKLSELYDSVYKAALERTTASGFTDEKAETAAKIAVAAMKFGDLINHRAKDYVFDMEKFLAADGKTGTFLLYTIARINSIMRKSGIHPAGPISVYAQAEREILLNLCLSGQVFQKAYEDRAPNTVCENAYQLSSLFSKFYHDCPILNEENEMIKNSRLSLCMGVKTVLLKHLDVLGIEPVQFM